MSRRIRMALAAASVVAVMGFTGCTAEPEPDLTTAQSEALRAQVVAIADTSSRGEYANALAALDALQAEVDQAVADGELDGDREQRIRDAMALVRSDLEAAVAAIPEPETQPEPAPAPAPAPAPPPANDGGDDSGPGNSDEGKAKGKGKGND